MIEIARGPRRLLLTGTAVLVFLALPREASAHGIGGRSDLPLPLEYFLVAALVVLLASFGLLAVAWPRPRLQGGRRWRGTGWLPPEWLTIVLRWVGVTGLALVVTAGLLDGGQGGNLGPIVVWVVFWLVIPFAAVATGNLWQVLNPWRAIGGLIRSEGPDGPGRLGVWPAAFALLAFVWLELIHPGSGDPATLAWAALFYTGYLALWTRVTGVSRAMASADAFTVYHRLFSGIAPFGRDAEGRVRYRGWLRGLVALPEWPGLAFFANAAIGSVTYDGLAGTPFWDDMGFALVGSAQHAIWFTTISLLIVVALVHLAYLGACRWAARAANTPGLRTTEVAASFAHTLVPIAVAYAFAHYFTLIAFEGQSLLAAFSDPFARGWDLFGTADFSPDFTWLPPVAVWWVQLIVILIGHLVAVTLAHDRALARLPGGDSVRSQYAMVALMGLLTCTGLTVLAVA